ncbi:DUF6265 family protein [Roseivirga pacifica]|uniref:DUF6265 family protein n=1 Tax=Roseivirga pacifica TaxID=1267423 RepID=UPI002095B86A|nr:DUF6265 family protein [Roseivirga pacifica]MCO6360893.1 hypothetical protein [Roseivirga pacifica]MCO6368782.1 hypothetical protein [Roseivirga pacifica]MCO6372926.1 hypothetical protein [Roseivirga pacifica]MCO6376986.1 hypothetical protein [Roseivirga pacifica]MCO6377737.1 hypothetical protein [Roseivirga pacifica]
MKHLLTLIFAFFASSLFAQNTIELGDAMSPKATLEQVAWIAGSWRGEAFGGQIEEVWTPPFGDSMMGSFKLVNNDKVTFYELCQIKAQNETLILRLKHFDGDLIGWEEKDESMEFPLVKLEKNKAYFDQFTFELVSENQLNMYVVIRDNGKTEEVEFKYFRY